MKLFRATGGPRPRANERGAPPTSEAAPPAARADLRDGRAGGVLEGRALLRDVEPLADVEVVARSRDLSAEVRGRTGRPLPARRPGAIFLSPSVPALDIRLTDGARIEGRVTARETGRPVAGAAVSLIGDSFSEGFDAERSDDVPRAETDDPLWNLAEGQTVRLDVALEPGGVLRGTVTGPAGPVAGALVSAWHATGEPFGELGRETARTAADGTFDIRGLPGRVIVLERSPVLRGRVTSSAGLPVGVAVEGHAPAVSGSIELETGRLDCSVDVALDAGLRLEGVVRDRTTGKPVAGAALRANVPDMYAWPPAGPPLSGFAVRAVTDAKGRFALDGLAPGALSVSAEAAGYVEARRSVSLPSGGPVEIDLRAQRSIAGVVVDAVGAPAPGAQVFFLGSEENTFHSEATADEAGRFRMDRLPAGDYRVIAVADGEGSGLAPAVVGPVPAGREDLRLALRRGEVLEGRLLDSRSKPLGGVVVSAGPTMDRPLRRYARTDEEGRFRLAGLPPGPQVVEFFEPGVTLTGVRPALGFEHRLRGEETISGRIRRQEFEVLRGVRAELTATPVGGTPTPGETSRHVARMDRDDGTFVFRYLPPGDYAITGTVEAGFRLGRRTFTLRGEVRAHTGDANVELRLRFAAGPGGQAVR